MSGEKDVTNNKEEHRFFSLYDSEQFENKELPKIIEGLPFS
jgi:hypothetical protein